MPRPIRLLLCEVFRTETLALLEAGGFDDVAPVFHPLRCVAPRNGAAPSHDPSSALCDLPARDRLIDAATDAATASLGCTLLPDPRKSGEAEPPPGGDANPRTLCFELVAPGALLAPHLRDGAYLVTPGWLLRWREHTAGWATDPDAAKSFCADSFSRILLLDTLVDSAAPERLAEFAAWAGRPAGRLAVGLDAFRLHAEAAVLRARLELARRGARRPAVPNDADDRAVHLADYAMALDLLADMSRAEPEERLAERLLEMLGMLFAPEAARYLSLDGGTVRFARTIPAAAADAEAEQSILAAVARQEEPAVERGFALPIGPPAAPLAVLAFEGIRFSRHIRHYRNLARAMAGVLAMAVERARAFTRQLETARLESISRLTGGIAHEYNNLLQIMLGHASLLTSAVGDGAPARGVAALLAAGRRAARLTQELLAFSARPDAAAPVVDAARIARDTLRAFAGETPPRVRAIFAPCPASLPVRFDPGELSRLLTHLLRNAVEAMPQGGTLTVEASAPALPGGESSTVRLVVRDTGIGMDPITRERAFDPLFSTKPAGGGAGMGLAVVQSLARRFGGRVEIASAPGEGCAVTLDLPFAELSEADGPPSATVAAEARPASILLAEDEPRVRDLFRAVLEGAGHRLVMAEDGMEAVAAFARAPEGFDLLLFDRMMPVLDGLAAIRKIRATHPGIPAALVTGEDARAVRDGIAPGERIAMIPKPVSPAELLARVRGLLDEPAKPDSAHEAPL